MGLSLAQGSQLVSIARGAIDSVVLHGKEPEDPEVSESRGRDIGFLEERRGAFVTIKTLEGDLRGCIGIPYPIKPLREAVLLAAAGAARHDPRFPRVEPSELDSLTVEVSALTPPEPLDFRPMDLPGLVRIGVDGLIVSCLGTSGLLLPQVATEMELSPKDFLALTCRKAGLSPDAWLARDVKVQRFQAEVFTETAPRGPVGELSVHA